MPVVIGVGLKEDDTRSIFEGIGGNSEGFQEAGEMENRL